MAHGGAGKAELTLGWGEQLVSSLNRISSACVKTILTELIQLLIDFGGFWKHQKKTQNLFIWTKKPSHLWLPRLNPRSGFATFGSFLWPTSLSSLSPTTSSSTIFKCLVDQLVNCGSKVEKSRWITRLCQAKDPVAWYAVKIQSSYKVFFKYEWFLFVTWSMIMMWLQSGPVWVGVVLCLQFAANPLRILLSFKLPPHPLPSPHLIKTILQTGLCITLLKNLLIPSPSHEYHFANHPCLFVTL